MIQKNGILCTSTQDIIGIPWYFYWFYITLSYNVDAISKYHDHSIFYQLYKTELIIQNNLASNKTICQHNCFIAQCTHDNHVGCRRKVVQFFSYLNFVHSKLHSNLKWPTGSHFVFWNHVFNHYSLTIVDRIITCRTKVVQGFFYFHFGQSDLDSNRKWPTGIHFVFQKSCFQPILLNPPTL